jgi:tetratricopeptide (TPR) repeat protein
MLGGAESLMDQLGTAGALLRPRMFGMWKDDAMQRRALLKLIGLASVTGVAGLPGANAPRAEVKATPETVQDLEDLAGRYQALYVSTASAILVPAVTAHLEVVRDLLREGSAAPLRRRLLANQAWVGGLAGRLAFFDSGDPVGGRGYFSLARESARAAGDHLQGAVTLYGMSRIAEEDRRFDAALDYLHAAHSMTSKRPDNRVTSYLCGNEARIQAEAGNHAVALAAIDRARDLFAEPVTDAGLPWLDWDNDAARLSHRHGQVTLFAGRLDESQAALTDALNLLPRDAVKQRTRILIDTAGVHRDRGDLDEACRIAGDAAEDLGRVWGAVRFHRLRDFRASVQQWSGSAPVRQLDERLAAVA